MKIIVVTDKNWGIGKNNDLLFSLKEDMKHFKQLTLNNTVVMGRKTFESLPHKRPLINRKNIILSSEASIDGAICVQTLSQLAQILREENPDNVFIMGGASIYKAMLPYCSQAIITKVDAIKDADRFFENLDLLKGWQLINESDFIKDGDYKIRFCIYQNNDVKEFLP